MLRQVMVGCVLVSCTIVVEAVFIGLAILGLNRTGAWLVTGHRVMKLVMTLIITTLWLFTALGVAIWIWAAAFMVLGLFESLEAALYFSSVAFTTLGFGDITLGPEWRLLSGVMAANGLVVFSLTTAFLIELMRHLNKATGESG